MTEDPDTGNAEAEDYEYDMAHEATADTRADAPTPTMPPPSSMHVTDSGGDYGYDAAHDQA
jgi:hypothetical protein